MPAKKIDSSDQRLESLKNALGSTAKRLDDLSIQLVLLHAERRPLMYRAHSKGDKQAQAELTMLNSKCLLLEGEADFCETAKSGLCRQLAEVLTVRGELSPSDKGEKSCL